MNRLQDLAEEFTAHSLKRQVIIVDQGQNCRDQKRKMCFQVVFIGGLQTDQLE